METKNDYDNFATSWVAMDKKAAEYRGLYLQAISAIEGTIDDTLAEYFCPLNKNKQDELMYAFLSSDKVTLGNKYAVFSFLAERYSKDLYDQYNPSKAQLKLIRKADPNFVSLETRAGEIIKLRNQFAHRKFNYSISEIFYGNKNENISLDTKVAKEGQLKDAPLQLNDKIIDAHLREISNVHNILVGLSIEIKIKGLKQTVGASEPL